MFTLLHKPSSSSRIPAAGWRRQIPGVLLSAALALGSMPVVQAFESFQVQDIQIEGLQRIDPGTVFGYMPVQVGSEFSEDDATRAVRALYATGFFSDVRIEVRDGVVV